ncbi:MAG: 3-dehydroquinate synthase [Tepidisphaeraceae bacterium]
MSIIMVKLPDASYGVSVRPGLIRGAGQVIRELTTRSKIGVVTDDRVAPHFLEPMIASLRSEKFEVIPVILPAGEEHKNLATMAKIFDGLLAAKVERTTPIVALGGGVIGDMTGFAAASILRGVPFIQMPTTLLSMVDASVGGKTGVNHAAGKNLIGAFHQPIAVLADTDSLKTLPQREFRSGLAECIKHEVIADGDGFNRLEKTLDRVLALESEALQQLVAHNVMIKARVVEQDPYEHGIRAHLNFGHTFGHGIEKASNYTILHGECVALGMVAANHVAVRLGMFPESSAQRVKTLIDRAGLPVRGLTFSADEIFSTMFSDKKVREGKLRFILPDRIGHVVIRDDVPEALVREAIEVLR